MADPAFAQKLIIEEVITIGASLSWELRQRRERFAREADFVAINTLCLAAATGALVWLVSPNRSYGALHKFPWQNYLHRLPNHVFDASTPLNRITAGARAAGFVAKAAELCAVGTVAGAAMSGLAQARCARPRCVWQCVVCAVLPGCLNEAWRLKQGLRGDCMAVACVGRGTGGPWSWSALKANARAGAGGPAAAAAARPGLHALGAHPRHAHERGRAGGHDGPVHQRALPGRGRHRPLPVRPQQLPVLLPSALHRLPRGVHLDRPAHAPAPAGAARAARAASLYGRLVPPCRLRPPCALVRGAHRPIATWPFVWLCCNHASLCMMHDAAAARVCLTRRPATFLPTRRSALVGSSCLAHRGICALQRRQRVLVPRADAVCLCRRACRWTRRGYPRPSRGWRRRRAVRPRARARRAASRRPAALQRRPRGERRAARVSRCRRRCSRRPHEAPGAVLDVCERVCVSCVRVLVPVCLLRPLCPLPCVC